MMLTLQNSSLKQDHFGLSGRILFRLTRKYLSDYTFSKIMMKRWLGYGDIRSPKSFNEKIQWLKLNDRRPFYQDLADKLAVRDYVHQKIGDEYLNELYATFNSSAEINLQKLPSSFVLKATHGSGMNLIISDKNEISDFQVQRKVDQWLRTDYYMKGREWVYKNIPRRIVCEKYLIEESGEMPKDYKFFCFNGEPMFVQVDVDRFSHHTRVFFNKSWEKQPFTVNYKIYQSLIDKPIKLDEMLDVAKRLSSGIPFARIDLYSIPRVIFGEITFYPGNGFEPFIPQEWDYYLGAHLKLIDKHR